MLSIPAVALKSARPANWPRVILQHGDRAAKLKAVKVLKGAK